MRKYVNNNDIPLAMAVYLASDGYNYAASRDEKTISVTTLLKPIRQVILTERMDFENVGVNLIDMVSNRIGHSIHDGIEQAWVNNHVEALQSLGYPQKFIDSVVVNPPADMDLSDKYPIYTEIRSNRKFGEYTITGQFDFAINGSIEDFKTTSVWTAIKQRSDDKYIQQMSIYKWLNPAIIDKDYSTIHWIFTDWSTVSSYSNPNYPSNRYQPKRFELMNTLETENFIRKKLSEYDTYKDLPEELLPVCSDEDLWRSEPQWKYYKNPAKRDRATKNFNNQYDAMTRFADDGFVGVVVEVKGKVKACKYCPAYLNCSQKDTYLATGELEL